MRICKTFLINTLGIPERQIRTVTASRTTGSGIIPEDKRGKHAEQPKIDEEVLDSVRAHIDSIPRVESHYIRANTSREFIDGGLSIAEMHRHYNKQQITSGKPSVKYDTYARIFNTEYNIGFFVPKKDQCDICEAFKNAEGEEKNNMETSHQEHLGEKRLSRAEKDQDKKNITEEGFKRILAVSDLYDDGIEELEGFEQRRRPKNENYITETVENYNEQEFIEHFRVSRNVLNSLEEQFAESYWFKYQTGNSKICANNHVLIFLWYAGHQTASFRDVADCFDISISSLFRVIRRVTYFLSNLAPQFIRWPDLNEKQEIERHFREKGFPGVIGAIDGSHVKLDKPSRDPESYYNRKKYFSIHMQAVCDHKRRIRSIFVGFPGSVHDARVFARSSLANTLAAKCGDYFILGDSAYSCSRNLVTPFKDEGNLSQRQRRFNQRLSSCLCIIEHCFGLLKQKFRQLYHIKLKSIPDIVHFVRACCVLHNMAIEDEFDVDLVEDGNDDAAIRVDLEMNDDELERDGPEGVAFRNHLLRTLNL
ncbi:hypothetical protein NQ315_010862 [Exocentrus adspersus]|uniref:Nuclease HARBI1 n=1 Tax=Exocentrus adspersus TaxID=1586481 RepID=A0AAV8VBF0_9CUCU|nr:hypothetical protein NQ315_010862 [Exocentrus adspersus]